MPLSTVHSYLQAQLDGLALPAVSGFTVPALQALVSIPTFGSPSGPQVYIRAQSWRTQRTGISVPSTKIRTYQMALTVRWATAVTAANKQPVTVFTAIVDAVLARLDALPKQVRAQDPVTGQWSTIGLLGNADAGDLQGPYSLADQRMQLWGCPIRAQLKELWLA